MFKKRFILRSNYERLKEYIFLSLISLSYQDFLNLDKPSPIGTEDQNLTGALITYNTTPKSKYYDISNAVNTIRAPKKVIEQGTDFFKELLGGDGGVIAEKEEILSNGVFFDGIVRLCKRKFEVKDFDNLFERFFPSELNKPGSRTRVGMSIALTGKKRGAVFVMNQTVYNKLGTGRILQFGKKGVERTFHLERNRRKLIGVIRRYKYDKNKRKLVFTGRRILTEEYLKKINDKLKKFGKRERKKLLSLLFDMSKKLDVFNITNQLYLNKVFDNLDNSI